MGIFNRFRKKIKQKKLILLINKKTSSSLSVNTLIDEYTIFEGHNLSRGNVDLRGSYIGYGSYFGNNIFLPKTRIGRFCSIPHNNHVETYKNSGYFISSYPGFVLHMLQLNDWEDFTSDANIDRYLLNNQYYCAIGNDVWIGRNVLIRGGSLLVMVLL